MAKTACGLTFVLLILGVHAVGAAGPLTDYLIQPVPFTHVHVGDGFWGSRIETNRKVTIPYAFKKCEETHRIDNFAVAGGLKEGTHQGLYFNDSDLYKVVEGAAYALAVHRDPQLEEYTDGVIAKIAAAQEDDGYLYTARTAPNPKRLPPGGRDRWASISGAHELYCVGHMYEAAVAYFQATGKRTLLDVALKNADLICEVFGPGKRLDPPGHQEIEIGLVRLYRLTGKKKYLDMAKFFLDQRGRPEGRGGLYGPYSQDHKPVVEQDKALGHSVRAGYLYCGMADVAALTSRADYVNAITRIWEDVVTKKLYITGGIGAQGGHEGFGEDYSLPNASAYCETCAAIANAMWNHRLFLSSGYGKYMDIVERVIYNGFLSGISLEGDTFFYPNRLESHSGGSRSAWFGCACCPSNVVRFVPSIPGYAYGRKGDDIYVDLFIEGQADIKTDTQVVKISQDHRYPWDGDIRITVEPEKDRSRFALLVRIPGWARNEPVPSDLYRYLGSPDVQAKLKVNGRPADISLRDGYARVRRRWRKGDVVELHLPMSVRRVTAHDKVVDDRDRVALERGPIVFCAEFADNKDGEVLNLCVPDDIELRAEFRQDLLGGVMTVKGRALAAKRTLEGDIIADGERDLVAIPYYAWCHRGKGQMAVWLARQMDAAKPEPAPTIAHTSKITVSNGGSIAALTDQLEPHSSIDHSNPYFHWWPRKGTLEWVQLDFKKAEKVSKATVYWFDDTGIGECRVPSSWRLLYREAEDWKPVENPSGYGVEKDTHNAVAFEPVVTNGVRFEVQLPERFSTGIHEMSIK